jgi:hypothetical protein
VFASHAEPNYSLPWQRKRQMASTSSGFIIEGARSVAKSLCRLRTRRALALTRRAQAAAC